MHSFPADSHRVDVPGLTLTATLAAILLAVVGASRAAEFTLSDFNGQGFDYTFDDFVQTLGPNAVRLSDSNNGWGGAGLGVGSLDLSPYSDGRLVIDLIPNAANQASRFDIELIDQGGPGGTQRSGKWTFDVSTLTPGEPTRLISNTPISAPTGGIGDFSNLDLTQVQTWQVLGDFGSPDPFDLSFDRISISTDAPLYPGAEPDAPWRAEAAARIESHRKADLAVSVVDRTGAPVPGATVEVEMQQHAFQFGSAVQAFRLRNNAAQHALYKAKVAELFNVATLENNLKWPPWEGEWGGNFTQGGAVAALDWLNAQGIDGRGHVMVWPGETNLPADIKQMLSDGDLSPSEQQTVRNRIAAHIASLGAATAGKVTAWDVVNETRTNNDLMRELSEGDQAMVDWFGLADTAAPDADLYMNDFGILNSWGQAAVNNRNQYYDTIEQLKNAGAKIDGVGFQGHFSGDDITPPEQILEIFDRFDELGLEMQITEFDMNTTDEALQAQYMADVMTAAFSHEGLNAFILWGFWENAHWRPEAALYRSDWSIKPNGEAYLDLLFDQWWTDEEATADDQGEASVRGFKGEYQVTATAGAESDTVNVTLSEDGDTATITLDLLVGDYNRDGRIDAADYSVWRDTFGSQTELAADGNNNGQIDEQDYLIWKERYGGASQPALAVPEPTAACLALFLAAAQAACCSR